MEKEELIKEGIVKENLKKEISASLKRGLDLEEIRQQLLNKHADYDIDEAINEVKPKEEEPVKKEVKEPVEEESIENWDKEE